MIERPGQADSGSLPPSPRAARPVIDMSDLLPRTASGIVMVAVALGTTVSGGPLFELLWLAAAIGIAWEWQRLMGPERQRARMVIAILAVTIATGLTIVGHGGLALLCLVAGAAGLAVVAGGQASILKGFGVLYAGALPWCMVSLRSSETFGVSVVLWLYAVVWGTDIMAYFGGRLIGGPKLWPRVSPSKTWSGFLVGVGSGALIGWLVGRSWQAAWPIVPLGLLTGSVAQAGDLFESSLKRRFGVKDSSRIIPGHGGLMDRLDGFLAAAVLATGFGILRAGLASPSAGILQW